MLQTLLKDPDKEILKQSQRSWVFFRDNEQKLFGAMAKEEYSGGGTIQNITVASEYLELTKARVFNLYNHILRMSEL